jgi:hypothetical protein
MRLSCCTGRQRHAGCVLRTGPCPLRSAWPVRSVPCHTCGASRRAESLGRECCLALQAVARGGGATQRYEDAHLRPRAHVGRPHGLWWRGGRAAALGGAAGLSGRRRRGGSHACGGKGTPPYLRSALPRPRSAGATQAIAAPQFLPFAIPPKTRAHAWPHVPAKPRLSPGPLTATISCPPRAPPPLSCRAPPPLSCRAPPPLSCRAPPPRARAPDIGGAPPSGNSGDGAAGGSRGSAACCCGGAPVSNPVDSRSSRGSALLPGSASAASGRLRKVPGSSRSDSGSDRPAGSGRGGRGEVAAQGHLRSAGGLQLSHVLRLARPSRCDPSAPPHV